LPFEAVALSDADLGMILAAWEARNTVGQPKVELMFAASRHWMS